MGLQAPRSSGAGPETHSLTRSLTVHSRRGRAVGAAARAHCRSHSALHATTCPELFAKAASYKSKIDSLVGAATVPLLMDADWLPIDGRRRYYTFIIVISRVTTH